jgi:hypothetical protein
MKLMAIVVGLLLLVGTAFPQDMQLQNPRMPQQLTLDKLATDAGTLPSEFVILTGQMKFDTWACDANEKGAIQEMVSSYTTQSKHMQYMVGTIKTQGKPNLPEVAESTYLFGVGISVSLILVAASTCTKQPDLTESFSKLSSKFLEAGDNSYTIEQSLIQSEESLLEQLYNIIKSLQREQVVPPKDHPRTSS